MQRSEATVKLKNMVLNVQTDVVLRKGDALTLRVEKQENAIYLRIGGVACEQADPARNTVLPIMPTYFAGESTTAARAFASCAWPRVQTTTNERWWLTTSGTGGANPSPST